MSAIIICNRGVELIGGLILQAEDEVSEEIVEEAVLAYQDIVAIPLILIIGDIPSGKIICSDADLERRCSYGLHITELDIEG